MIHSNFSKTDASSRGFCPRCREKKRAGARFCPRCGMAQREGSATFVAPRKVVLPALAILLLVLLPTFLFALRWFAGSGEPGQSSGELGQSTLPQPVPPEESAEVFPQRTMPWPVPGNLPAAVPHTPNLVGSKEDTGTRSQTVRQLPPDLKRSGAGASEKLNMSLAGVVRDAVVNNIFSSTSVQGGAFATIPFQETSPDGILIGFRIGMYKFFNNDTISSVQPIYLTPRGEENGQSYGRNAQRFVICEAPVGYAVGKVKMRGGGGMDALTLTFMRIGGGSLDPTDAYISEQIGGNGGGESTFGGDGTPIIGIHGKVAEHDQWLGLGLIFLHPTDSGTTH